MYVCTQRLQIQTLTRTNKPCMKPNIPQIPIVCKGYIIYLNNRAFHPIYCTKMDGIGAGGVCGVFRILGNFKTSVLLFLGQMREQ